MQTVQTYIPYCGTAPIPAEIWVRWNMDWLLILVLAALYALHASRTQILSRASVAPVWRRACFHGGWAALALALLSPLCALSVALFSARVTQHMWIAMVAAPLLALAWGPATRASSVFTPMRSAGVFAIALWSWHLPRLYDSTFLSDAAYWLMHVSIAVTAVMVWRAVLSGPREQFIARLGAAFVTLMQMGLLGALITFAPRVLYQAHLLTASAWGLNPLQDQQLGGLIMWVPATATILFAPLWMLNRLLTGRDAEAPPSSGRVDV